MELNQRYLIWEMNINKHVTDSAADDQGKTLSKFYGLVLWRLSVTTCIEIFDQLRKVFKLSGMYV